MAIRTVLASASGTKESKTLLSSAFRVAKDLDAHLNVLHVRTDPRETIPLLGEGMSARTQPQKWDTPWSSTPRCLIPDARP